MSSDPDTKQPLSQLYNQYSEVQREIHSFEKKWMDSKIIEQNLK